MYVVDFGIGKYAFISLDFLQRALDMCIVQAQTCTKARQDFSTHLVLKSKVYSLLYDMYCTRVNRLGESRPNNLGHIYV